MTGQEWSRAAWLAAAAAQGRHLDRAARLLAGALADRANVLGVVAEDVATVAACCALSPDLATAAVQTLAEVGLLTRGAAGQITLTAPRGRT